MSYPGHSLERGSYPSTEMQSVYSTTPANWATRWWSLIPLHRFIIYMSMSIIRLFSVISRTFVGERVLPLYRDAVCVLYNPSQLGNSLVESYSSAQIHYIHEHVYHQIVYCHIQDTRWRGVLPLYRNAVCVRQLGNSLVESYSSAEIHYIHRLYLRHRD